MRWTVERLMVWAWASLMMVAAISSSVQLLTGRSWSAGLDVAIVTTQRRSEGGKAPGSTGARIVLQALQPLGREAFPPLANRMPVTAQFSGDLLIGQVVRASR